MIINELSMFFFLSLKEDCIVKKFLSMVIISFHVQEEHYDDLYFGTFTLMIWSTTLVSSKCIYTYHNLERERGTQ